MGFIVLRPGATRQPHHLDCQGRSPQAGASLVAPQAVTSRSTRDRYLLGSLMEEAITSSQMEGAATTRGVAKAMILNNFLAQQA